MTTTEKIICISNKHISEIFLNKTGENYMPCPECSSNRKKNKDKCMSYNLQMGVGYCNHCEERFVKYEPYEKEIKYHIPKWENFTKLSDKAVKYMQGRMISQSTITKMNISSKKVYFSQTESENEAICIPFYKGGELVNIKYRDARKNFKLEKGAELIWYNYDALLNNKEIIITEGEFDALTYIDEGFNNVISVPNGANISNMPYFEESLELFEKIDKIYISVDNDTKGLLLQNELVRRLGAEKCYICSYKQFKDINEYVTHFGKKSASEVLKNAKEPKVDDIYNSEDFFDGIKDLYENGMKEGLTIGIPLLDELISWESKRLLIVSGTPQSGKSDMIDFLNIKLNLMYKWKVAYWSPENFPLQYHYAKISEKLTGKKFNKDRMDENHFWQSYNYIKDNFFWVSPEDDMSVDTILNKFKFLVKSKGIKVCCIDPFNKLEYKLEKGDNKLDYISKLLDKLIWFAKKNDVLMQLVAHPRKLEKLKDGTYPMPTMYDISGSSDFFNKTDYAFIVQRNQDIETKEFLNTGKLSVQKVKFKHLGKMGIWEWKYNYNNGRFENDNSVVDNWDNSNWLNSEIKNNEPIITDNFNDIIKKINLNYESDECPF